MDEIRTDVRDIISPETITNPVKAIRAKCLDCTCNSSAEVERCTVTKCACHPFRFGKNPYRTKRVLTEEQKQAAKARLANHRNTRS